MSSFDQRAKSAGDAASGCRIEPGCSDQANVQVRGKPVKLQSARVDGLTVAATGRWIKIAAIADEDLVEGETVADPEGFVRRLKATGLRADLFTFAQKLPDTEPHHPFHMEWDNLAVIPITTFAEWWDKRVESSVRRAVRKAAKTGVVARVAEFDDAFVRGIAEIYNETPIRQLRAFWHYRKDLETVRRENSTYFERSTFIGAYFEGKMIGFSRMIRVDKIASIVQILSMVRHADKRPTNALIAKAVEFAEQRGISHLVYCQYVYNDPKSSLTEFKRRNGFEQVLLPRYYVPLTPKGRLALRWGLHRGLAANIPAPVVTALLKVRRFVNERRGLVAQETA